MTTLPPLQTVSTPVESVNAIPDNDPTGVTDSITVTGSAISNLEFVQVTVSAADHPYAGDLK